MNWVTPKELCERFDGFLLDAYGVLVNSDGILSGADEFLCRLRATNKPFCVVSNDASTTPEAKVQRWAARGLHLELDRLLTPWQVLASDQGPVSLAGLGCYLIGTPLSRVMLERAGGHLVSDARELQALVIADELEENIWRHCDEGLSLIVDAVRAGADPALVLVNPDLVYPSARGFGFTAGSIALMFEASLERLFGRPFRFTPVGKPEPHLFELGLAHLGLPKGRVAMIGDQLETDIRGAKQVGLSPVLIGTGVTPLSQATFEREPGVLHLESFQSLVS